MHKQTRTSIQKVEFTWWDGNGFGGNLCLLSLSVSTGSPLDFDDTQMKRLESNGTAVEPYSLYEAQLRKRLGICSFLAILFKIITLKTI